MMCIEGRIRVQGKVYMVNRRGWLSLFVAACLTKGSRQIASVPLERARGHSKFSLNKLAVTDYIRSVRRIIEGSAAVLRVLRTVCWRSRAKVTSEALTEARGSDQG